jgi:hypothetical protein
MGAVYSKEELKRRLGPPDLLQIRLLLGVPPERRVLTMLDMQAVVLNMWYDRLRRSHPEISNMELTRMVYHQIYRNG